MEFLPGELKSAARWYIPPLSHFFFIFQLTDMSPLPDINSRIPCRHSSLMLFMTFLLLLNSYYIRKQYRVPYPFAFWL